MCEQCRCDDLGSASQVCEPIGGQCPCLPGVIGRECDMCQAKQGEITQSGKGCKSKNYQVVILGNITGYVSLCDRLVEATVAQLITL